MASVDLTIMGGGIFGLACAWEAARRGAKVRVIERARLGAGSSGGLVGALSPHMPENWNPKKQFQLESLLMAERFWADVANASGLSPGYARLGRLQPLSDEGAATKAEARSVEAAQLWQGKASWRVVAAESHAWAPVSPSGLLIEDTLSARLHPRLAARALASAIKAHGGQIDFGDLTPGSGPVLWATGYPGLMALNAALGAMVGAGVKGQSLVLRYAAADCPQIYAPGLHIVPHEDGTVAIGSTSENQWDDPQAVDAQLEDLYRKALTVCPQLAGADIIERWAGVRPRARSRAPMLGFWPERPGHFIANGGFKIGFGMAPKVAEVMADLILDGVDRIPSGFRVADCL